MTDETNKNFAAGKFFLYGGLVFDDSQAVAVSDEVSRIRAKYGWSPADSFKFNTKARPVQVSIAQSKEAKQELVEALERLGVRMIVYLILHDIAKAKSDEVRMNFALNTVTWTFHRLLREERSKGLMLIDRDDSQFSHLEALFQTGITVKSKTTRVDDHILGFGQSSDNASHLSSAVDITLGAFRYCVNAAGGDGRNEAAENMFPPLTRLLWGVTDGAGQKTVGGYGFVARPLTVTHHLHRANYSNLRAKLDRYSDGTSAESADSGAL